MIHRKCSRNLKLSFLYLLAFLKIIGNKKKLAVICMRIKWVRAIRCTFFNVTFKYRKDFRIHNCINCLNTHSYFSEVFSCWDCLFATSHIGPLPTESRHYMISLSAAEVSFAYLTYSVRYYFTITPGDPCITLETYITYRDTWVNCHETKSSMDHDHIKPIDQE